LQKRLTDRKVTLNISDAAKSWLVKVGYDPAFGARPLRRAIEQYVESPLANRLLKGEFKEGDAILVDSGPDGLSFSTPENSPVKKTRRSSEAMENKTQE
jgi:ATP-dependent Clp protease ATP-binding subunit ClpC